MRAHRDQHGIETLMAKVGIHEIASGCLVEFESNVSGLEYFPHLRFNHIAVSDIRVFPDRAFRRRPAPLQRS